MKKFTKTLGIIVFVAVIGISMAACKQPTDGGGGGSGGTGFNTSLIGKWQDNTFTMEIFSNGSYTNEQMNKGNLSTSGNRFTATITHWWGTQSMVSNYNLGLTTQWYTKAELQAKGLSATDAAALFTPVTGTYSVGGNGSTLTLTYDNSNMGGPVTFTKQ